MLLTPVLLAQSDVRLIELARAGHERAFEVLVRRYRPQLLAHCRRILPADAGEDAVQHGLLGAWMALQNGSEVREARAWLHRVVHNAALRAISVAGGHAELTDVQLGAEGPEELLIRRQDLHDALRAIASLPELQREALIQTSVEGQSYESVAEMLGLSQTSLRGLIYRARATMRAAASAVMPLPLLSWLLERARRASARTTAVQAGSCPAAAGSLLAKGGAVVLAVSAAAGGVGAAHLAASADSHRTHVHAVHRALSAHLDAAITVDMPTSRDPSVAPATSRYGLARKLSPSGRSVVARPAATVAAPAPVTIARATSGSDAGSSSEATGRQSRSGSADSSSGWKESSGGSGDGNGQTSTSQTTTTDSESWSGSGDSTNTATTDTTTTDTTTTGATSTGSSSPGG